MTLNLSKCHYTLKKNDLEEMIDDLCLTEELN